MTVTRFLGTGEARVVVAHEDITRQIESQEVMAAVRSSSGVWRTSPRS